MVEATIGSEATMPGEDATVLAGRYRVVRQLGQGGMGSVWLAEDLKLDGYKVAVKMLPSVLFANARAYEQLKAEALVSLKLTHPNIATVRAFEENGGNPFLVIDYIDGETLDDLLAEKANLTEAETIRILTPVAAALDYAHRQGVVHRDVKPGNVMIAKDGTPYVLDFGIAREIQETMTRVTGKLSSGTLLYMSPEQLKGEAPKPAQDVYSFAAMAYECLKGEPPFSRGQIEYQILNEEPEPLSGESLARAVMQGLSKDPAGRPANCRAVLCAPRRPFVARRKPELRKTVPTVRLTPFLSQPWAKPALAVVAGLFVLCACICWRASVSTRIRQTEQESQKENERKEQDLTIDRIVHEEERRRKVLERSEQRKAEESRKAEAARKSAVSGVLNEATARLAAVRKLSGEDGIGNLMADGERQFKEAEGHYRAARWREAARAYTNVVETCRKVVELEGRRIEMAVVRKGMIAARDAARSAAAAKFARNTFALAEGLQAKGDEARRGMRFEDAEKSYRQATERFAQAGEKARETSSRLSAETPEEKTLAAFQTRVRQQRAMLGRVVGAWTTVFSCIVKSADQAPERLVNTETLQFDADGSFTQRTECLTECATEIARGRWGMNGDTLTLRYESGEMQDESVSYVLSWTSRDAFEMRLSQSELGKRRTRRIGKVQFLSSYYDSVGALHEKVTGSRYRKGTCEVVVMPKRYERDVSSRFGR